MSENTRSLGLIQQPQLVNLLDAAPEQFDPVLFPPHSLELIRSLTAKLPLTNSLLFELRMLESDSTLDLSLPFPENFSSQAREWSCFYPWDGIISLHRACQTGGELAGSIGSHVFWFEFDSDQMLQPIPIPGVFLDVSPELSQPENKSLLAQLLCRATSILRGKKVPDSTHQGLENLLNTLPEGVCCTHFGVMLSRKEGTAPVSSIRVNFGRWEQVGDIAAWLEIMGCNTVAAELAKVIEQIPNLLGRAIVTLDIAASIGPRIGLECYPTAMEDASSSQQGSRWLATFTAWLEERSLASRQKAQALFGWDSDTSVPIPPHSDGGWLSNYSACEANLSHLKLVFEPLAGLQAKAYLLANFVDQDEAESQSARLAFESFTQIWKADSSTF